MENDRACLCAGSAEMLAMTIGLFLHNGKTRGRQCIEAGCAVFRPKFNPCTTLVDHLRNNTRSNYGGGRFSDRRKRIARRTERDTFRRILMPALYTIGVLGLVIFAATAIYAVVADTDISPFSVIVAAPALLIGLMEGYRLLRGHHSNSLEEP